VLPNEKGLAPGFIIRHYDKLIIAMPGVPSEVVDMVDRSVVPFLRDECGIGEKNTFSFRVIGMKESDINASILNMSIPIERLQWGMTAREGITTLTFVDTDGSGADFSAIANDVKRVFGERFLDPAWERPEEEVLEILRKRKLTVAFAESCTGGLVSKRITDIAGASDVFIGSVVAYRNSIKTGQLGVSREVLERYGAVSPETASEMATGVRSSLGADIGISITGIAGPGGGSDAKPVGTVWFGLADETGVSSFTRLISGSRDRVRTMASLIVIENLRSYLKHLAAS
jgi:nicotinamide-nucleotide amidase